MFGCATAVLFSAALLGASPATVTGTVADAMCGAKHAVADAAGCTRGCVKKGSDYALVVKDKVYTLKADEAAKAELDKLAGHHAKVTGEQKGDTITVTAVVAAK
jgi:hypothetical protein